MTKTTAVSRLRLTASFVLLLVIRTSLCADSGYFFYIQFTDKHQSPYSLTHPETFLSTRSLERRSRLGIAVDSTDLPVNPGYLQAIAAKNIRIYNTSKWMNGATVLLADSSLMNSVRALPCVKFVQYTGKRTATASSVRARSKFASESYSYGNAAAQINQTNGQFLHQKGYTGHNIYIGILDAGFYNANNNTAFDSLRLQGRLLGVKNFAEPGTDVYGLDQHGANVLSIMAGNVPNQYLGTAPHASYLLVCTEYVPTEYLSETDFWCAGIEYADSVGVDIINSSLGYTTFDDSRMDFSYANMNGKTSRASLAATLAARKGIITCNSAGNDGNKTWHYLGVPADADSILTVGAVTSSGTVSAFSSFGPSADGRTKPESCATGTGTAFVAYNGVPTSGSGTSYSCPVITGLTACLLQALRTEGRACGPAAVRDAIVRSGSLYSQPNTQMGYGIANFESAYAMIQSTGTHSPAATNQPVAITSENKTIRIIRAGSETTTKAAMRLYNTNGICCYHTTLNTADCLIDLSKLAKGVYLVRIDNNQHSYTQKITL